MHVPTLGAAMVGVEGNDQVARSSLPGPRDRLRRLENKGVVMSVVGDNNQLLVEKDRVPAFPLRRLGVVG